jgi:hypothetical protein
MKTPNHLSGDSKKWWRKIASQFDFDDTAFLLLQTMFECYDEFKSARANLMKYGPLLKAKSGRLLNLSLEPPNEVGRPPGNRRRFEDETDF